MRLGLSALLLALAFGIVPAPQAANAEDSSVLSALIWAGDYTGGGSADEAMTAAIKHYQNRNHAKVTGTLTPEERDNLVAATREHEKEFGWNVVVDPATGIRIGIPTRMLPVTHEAANGTRWTSPHGEIQVITFRLKTNESLNALFERQKKEPPGRQIEYSTARDNSFIVSGLQGLKKFTVRAQLRDGELRGVTMLYDQMMEGIVAPVMVAMTSAFVPFPERSAPFAALSKSVEYGSGLIVSARGDIVTDRKVVEGCEVIVASGLGDAERVADDKEHGLALLRVYGAHKVAPLALGEAAPKAGDLRLIGIADPKEQNGNHARSEIKARLTDAGGIELRQSVPLAGFSGAAAIDAGGKFLGMMQARNAVLASIEPSVPPMRLVSAESIRAFLAAHGGTPAQTGATDAAASVVQIICVRK